jgi:hypothetical protein
VVATRSTLGTIVNNRPSGDFARQRAAAPGENTVVAGGRESPFVFTVTLSIPAPPCRAAPWRRIEDRPKADG